MRRVREMLIGIRSNGFFASALGWLVVVSVRPQFFVRQNGHIFTFPPDNFIHFIPDGESDDRVQDHSKTMGGNVFCLYSILVYNGMTTWSVSSIMLGALTYSSLMVLIMIIP